MLLGSITSSNAKNGCPACSGEKNTVQFNWKWAKQAPQSDWGAAPRFLIPKKKLKSGFLFQCSSCDQFWHLEDTQEKMTLLTPGHVRLIEAWSTTKLNLPEELWIQIRGIGATPPHHLDRQTQYAEIPCRIQTREGEWLDKCLLTFSSAPPLADYFCKAHLMSEIADIEPSTYALPVDVRLAASRSQLDSKGQALTLVENPQGKRLWLNWNVNFVDRKGTQGQDLRLIDASSNKKKVGKLAVVKEPIDSINFFFGDWSETVQQLLPR